MSRLTYGVHTKPGVEHYCRCNTSTQEQVRPKREVLAHDVYGEPNDARRIHQRTDSQPPHAAHAAQLRVHGTSPFLGFS